MYPLNTKPFEAEIPTLPWQSLAQAEQRKQSKLPAIPVPHPPLPRTPEKGLLARSPSLPGAGRQPVDLSRPCPNLGHRVLSELAGNQAFKASADGERLLPLRTLEALSGPKASMKSVAKELGLTPRAVSRIAKAYTEGGEAAVEQLNWRRGRPVKNHFFTPAEIDKMVSRATLNRQVGMSLKARAEEFSKRFKKPLKYWQLRDFYRGRGVTMQVAKPRLGPDNLGTPQEQQAQIRRLQEDVQEAIDEELELFCIDECVFNSKGGKRRAWAPA